MKVIPFILKAYYSTFTDNKKTPYKNGASNGSVGGEITCNFSGIVGAGSGKFRHEVLKTNRKGDLKLKNKNKVLLISFLILAVLVINITYAEATRTAVIGFGSEDSSWIENEDNEQKILEEIAWLFNDRLANVEGYSVLGRDRMLAILDELDYKKGQKPSTSTIYRLKDNSNAEIFVYGRLEKVDVQKKEVFSIGPIVKSEIEMSVELSIDMIDADNGRVIKTFNGRGREVASTMKIIDINVNEISSRQESGEDILYKTIKSAVNDLIKNIETEAVVEESREESIEANILSIVQEKLIINKGMRDGLEIGQVGDIIKYKTTDSKKSIIIVGEAKIVDIDQNSAFLETVYLNQKLTLDEKISFTTKLDSSDDNQYSTPIKEVNTSDFEIVIKDITKSNERVTILGTAYAKRDNIELELILANRDFYGHKGNRRDMTGKRVSIGAWINSSNNIATITDRFQKGETKNISWSFTGVSEEADKITRVQLGLKTQQEGEISIDLSYLKF